MKDRATILIAILGSILLHLTISCSDDDSYFIRGENLIDSNTRVIKTDTMTVRSSTFKFDSIIFPQAGRILIGAYNDPVFGLVKSKSYAQYYVENYTMDIDNSAIFDSIALVLKYDKYIYNDTLQPQQFYIYEVLENIKPIDGDYYNTTQFQTSDMPIGTKIVTPYPKKEDSIHIKIDDAFGSELFNKIRTNDINNYDELLQQYKGLSMDADASNTAVLGFSKSSVLRIYFSIDDEIQNRDEVFDIGFHPTNSINITTGSYENTLFEPLTGQQVFLPSYTTENNSYIQSGTGIATRMDIPHIKSLYQIEGRGILMDANLRISLNPASGTSNMPVSDSIAVYIINQRSEILSVLKNHNDQDIYAVKNDEDTEYGVFNYTLPIGFYLQNKLTNPNGHNWFLALYPENYNNLVDRYILYGERAASNVKLKLELTYALYDE